MVTFGSALRRGPLNEKWPSRLRESSKPENESLNPAGSIHTKATLRFTDLGDDFLEAPLGALKLSVSVQFLAEPGLPIVPGI